MTYRDQPNRPVEILMVDDSIEDAELTRLALQEGKFSNILHTVEDGVEAMAFLNRDAPYSYMPRPDLILLDLNMPRKNGRETLEEIKRNPEFCDIAVVILTTSEAERDIVEKYNLPANCYITKPVDMLQLAYIVKSIDRFSFSVRTLTS